jgi:uncharacterized membrane protein YcjF (UPF0283 family)
MGLGFATWLGIAAVGSLGWSAVSWSLLQRRLRRNRDGRCANCDVPLGEDRTRIGGLVLCAVCARRSRRLVTFAVRAFFVIVVVGSVVMLWAVQRVWEVNRRGAWLMIGLWGLYASVLLFLAVLSARDAREAGRRVMRMERRLTPRDAGARKGPER